MEWGMFRHLQALFRPASDMVQVPTCFYSDKSHTRGVVCHVVLRNCVVKKSNDSRFSKIRMTYLVVSSLYDLSFLCGKMWLA